MKRVIIYTLSVLLTLAGVLLFWVFRDAFILLFFSLAFAAAFRPGIELFSRWMPRGVAILIVYAAVLILVGGLVYLVGGKLLTDIQQATNAFAEVYNRAQTNWVHGTQLQQMIAARMPPLDALYRGVAGNQGMDLASNIFGVASGVANFFGQFVVILVLSIYLNADYARFERLWLSLLPSSQRSRAREIWSGIDRGVGAYIRSEFIQSLLAGILLGGIYWLIGLPYPTLLAVLAALFWLIPLLGVIFAIIPPLLVGLTLNPAFAIAAAVLTLVILGALEIFVEPRIFHRRRYSAILIALMMLALFDAFGLLGLLIAPPIAAAIQIFFSSLLTAPVIEPEIDPIIQISLLREELSQVEDRVAMEHEVSPQVISLKDRLRGLIEQSEQAIKAETSAEH